MYYVDVYGWRALGDSHHPPTFGLLFASPGWYTCTWESAAVGTAHDMATSCKGSERQQHWLKLLLGAGHCARLLTECCIVAAMLPIACADGSRVHCCLFAFVPVHMPVNCEVGGPSYSAIHPAPYNVPYRRSRTGQVCLPIATVPTGDSQEWQSCSTRNSAMKCC